MVLDIVNHLSCLSVRPDNAFLGPAGFFAISCQLIFSHMPADMCHAIKNLCPELAFGVLKFQK